MIDTRQAYTAAIDAVQEQRDRLGLGDTGGGSRWDGASARFTADPRRQPDANLAAILEYIAPEQVVLDVGGGAGRIGLPIALRCKELVNVEPSRGMGETFEVLALESGITNARWVSSEWMEAGDVSGDVSLVANVTYFVRDAVPFIEKLVAASRERVIITMGVTPPPNQSARLFELVNDEAQALVPGYRELLPVLWEMGIVPDVHLLHEARVGALAGTYEDREACLASLDDPRQAYSPTAEAASDRDESESARLRGVFEAHFNELFEHVPAGFRRRASGDLRMMLLTWRTAPSSTSTSPSTSSRT